MNMVMIKTNRTKMNMVMIKTKPTSIFSMMMITIIIIMVVMNRISMDRMNIYLRTFSKRYSRIQFKWAISKKFIRRPISNTSSKSSNLMQASSNFLPKETYRFLILRMCLKKSTYFSRPITLNYVKYFTGHTKERSSIKKNIKINSNWCGYK